MDSINGAKRSYGFFVAFMVLISALGSFVNDMFTPALPEMCVFFHTGIPTVQMGLTFGMIGLGVGQFFLGPFSDKYGRKPILIGSMSLFLAAAVVSIFSPTIEFFIGCRLIQGLGASGAYLLAKTMPTDLFSGRELGKVMALIGAINGLAPASAPVVGGFIAESFGWRGIFSALAIFTVLILALSPFVKETLPKDKRFTGTFWGLFDGYQVLLINYRFMVQVVFKSFALGLLFAYISAAPFILQNYYGYSQSTYGMIIGFNVIFVVAGATAAMRFRPLKKASIVGAGLVLIGAVAQAAALRWIKDIWVFECCMNVILLGLGLIFTVTNTLAMNEGREKAGEASSLLGIGGYAVGAVSAPLVGIGNVLHSTGYVFITLAFAVFLCAYAASKFPVDLQQKEEN